MYSLSYACLYLLLVYIHSSYLLDSNKFNNSWKIIHRINPKTYIVAMYQATFFIYICVHTLSLYSLHSDLLYYIPDRTCKILGKVKYNSKRRRLTLKFLTNPKGRDATFECKIIESRNRWFHPCELFNMKHMKLDQTFKSLKLQLLV